MGVITKTKFSDFSIHPLVRGDFKFINYKKNIETIYPKSHKVKECIKGYYKGFAFKSSDFETDGEIFVIKGDMFENDLTIDYSKADFLPYDFYECEKYEKFKVLKDDVIVSLVGSIGKMVIVQEGQSSLLNQNNIALQIDKTKNEVRFFAYVLKKAIKELADNVYKNYGYSFLAIDDLFEIKLPLVSIENQRIIIPRITEIEKEITKLKSTALKPVNIINKVFGEEFGFDWSEFENVKKEKTYTSSISKFANNIDCRMGIRFHNKAGAYIQSFLESKTNKRIKDFISENIVLGKSVSPSDYDEDGEYFYIAMSNIKTWAFAPEDCKKVSETYAASNLNKTVKKGDILLARSGEGTIGKVALIEDEDINGIFADFTQRIRLTGFDPLCAYYYMRSEFFQYLVYTHKKGLGNNTNIFPSQIKEFPIPDWDETKQAEIVEKIKTQLDEQKVIDRQIEEKQQTINKIIEDAIIKS